MRMRRRVGVTGSAHPHPDMPEDFREVEPPYGAERLRIDEGRPAGASGRCHLTMLRDGERERVEIDRLLEPRGRGWLQVMNSAREVIHPRKYDDRDVRPRSVRVLVLTEEEAIDMREH